MSSGVNNVSPRALVFGGRIPNNMSAVQPMLPPRCSPSFPPGEVEGCGGPEPPSGGPEPPSGGPEPPSGGPEPPSGGPVPPSGGPEPPSGGPVPPSGGPEPPSGGPVPPSGGPETESLRMFLNQRLTAAVDDILGVFGRTVARYREEIDRQRRQLDSLRSEDSRWKRAADLLQTFSWMKNCPEDQVRCVQLDQTGSVVETEAGHVDPGAAADASDTEDSGDWREAAGPRKPEDTGDTEGQSSRPSAKVRSPKVRSPKVRSPTEHKPSHQLLLDFTCQVCGGSFQRRSHLLKHTAAHLRDCGVCGKHLERTESLKLHLQVHRDTSFRCSVCGQTFTLRGNLRTHMRIHSGERPYGCTVCEKSFGRRATLVRHMRSHTGEKPFSCTFCGRGFVEKGNLTVHLRTHTGERPYWCSACGRRFSQLSCYYKHPCQRGLTCPPDRMNT